MRETYIVDRIENNHYILESLDGNVISISKDIVEIPLKSGDVIYKKDEKYYYSKEETMKRKNYISKLMEGMWEE